MCLLACVSACSPASPVTPPAIASPALPGDLAPTALAASPDGQTLYIACAEANQVLAFDVTKRQVIHRLATPSTPSGLALSPDGARLFVTCASPASQICIFDTKSARMLSTLIAGHTALSPVLSADGQTLFVCNRFNDAISLFDLRRNQEIVRLPVPREPVSAALTRDGRFLLIANHLPRGRSDVPYVTATISVIDVAQRKVVKELRLLNGSIDLRQIAVSPDGKYAAVALTVARFQLPVTQLARAWVNASALTLIDVSRMEVLNTVILDDVDRGAANPWAVAWSADSRALCVTHAGTHELSILDFPALLKKLAALDGPVRAKASEASPAKAGTPYPPYGVPALAGKVPDNSNGTPDASQVPNDLSFLRELRRRVALTGLGPRSVVLVADRAYVANYFSDSLDVVAVSAPRPAAEGIALNPGLQLSKLRRGELSFNDASISFQGWQSCASCHDDDARVDGVQWDLLNDGIGNPKDVKSLLLSHRTPPVMSLGVRSTAEIAVRNGIVNSLASVMPEEVPAAMDEWIKSLKPAPSPHLVNGQLSEAARRGEQLFNSPETRCVSCHEGELLTDLHSYDVGTTNPYDKDAREFDTPTLHELWRTAPYLHDGSAATLRDVLTTRNPRDQHGKTSHLTPSQLDDLAEYVLSL